MLLDGGSCQSLNIYNNTQLCRVTLERSNWRWEKALNRLTVIVEWLHSKKNVMYSLKLKIFSARTWGGAPNARFSWISQCHCEEFQAVHYCSVAMRAHEHVLCFHLETKDNIMLCLHKAVEVVTWAGVDYCCAWSRVNCYLPFWWNPENQNRLTVTNRLLTMWLNMWTHEWRCCWRRRLAS